MRNKLYAFLLNYKLAVSGLFLIGSMLSGFAYAEDPAVKPKEPLSITLTAQKVEKDAQGKEIFSNADKLKPGEILEYHASYANISQGKLTGVKADLPIPEGMEYVNDSARPSGVLATLDGKVYEKAPLKRKVKDKTGKEVMQLVPVKEYRALRWILGDIQAGKTLNVSARMMLSK